MPNFLLEVCTFSPYVKITQLAQGYLFPPGGLCPHLNLGRCIVFILILHWPGNSVYSLLGRVLSLAASILWACMAEALRISPFSHIHPLLDHPHRHLYLMSLVQPFPLSKFPVVYRVEEVWLVIWLTGWERCSRNLSLKLFMKYLGDSKGI